MMELDWVNHHVLEIFESYYCLPLYNYNYLFVRLYYNLEC